MGRNPIQCNSTGLLCWILAAVLIFGTLAVLQQKFKFMGELPNPCESKSVSSLPPAMPESKSELKSPVLDQALDEQLASQEVNAILSKLKLNKHGSEKLIVTILVSQIEARKFLWELAKDEESLKIFRQFWDKGIKIYLADKNIVNTARNINFFIILSPCLCFN